MIRLVLPLAPTPKNRKNRMRGRMVTDPKYQAWERDAVSFAIPHAPKRPLIGPLRMDVTFWFQRPKHPPKRSAPCTVDLKATRPDLDNLEKAIGDVLGKARYYLDDAQVCVRTSRKGYADKPSIVIEIEAFEEQPR